MYFSESHEWVKKENDEWAVGITQYAAHELGDIVYVELPEVGALLKKGDEVVVLESTKAAADVYSPVSGEITEVNEILKEKPELLNQSPESEGWLFKIKMNHSEEIQELMDAEKYKNFIA